MLTLSSGGAQVTKKLLSVTGACIRDYSMITAGDKVMVGLSGGKDSLTLLALLLALQRKSPVKFEIGVCTVDPSASERGRGVSLQCLPPRFHRCTAFFFLYTLLPFQISWRNRP